MMELPPPSNFFSSLQFFREKGLFCDVRLRFADQTCFNAHRVVIAAASQKLSKLLASYPHDSGCEKILIPMPPDCPPSVAAFILAWIYHEPTKLERSYEIVNLEFLSELRSGAKSLGIMGLVKGVEGLLLDLQGHEDQHGLNENNDFLNNSGQGINLASLSGLDMPPGLNGFKEEMDEDNQRIRNLDAMEEFRSRVIDQRLDSTQPSLVNPFSAIPPPQMNKPEKELIVSLNKLRKSDIPIKRKRYRPSVSDNQVPKKSTKRKDLANDGNNLKQQLTPDLANNNCQLMNGNLGLVENQNQEEDQIPLRDTSIQVSLKEMEFPDELEENVSNTVGEKEQEGGKEVEMSRVEEAEEVDEEGKEDAESGVKIDLDRRSPMFDSDFQNDKDESEKKPTPKRVVHAVRFRGRFVKKSKLPSLIKQDELKKQYEEIRSNLPPLMKKKRKNYPRKRKIKYDAEGNILPPRKHRSKEELEAQRILDETIEQCQFCGMYLTHKKMKGHHWETHRKEMMAKMYPKEEPKPNPNDPILMEHLTEEGFHCQRCDFKIFKEPVEDPDRVRLLYRDYKKEGVKHLYKTHGILCDKIGFACPQKGCKSVLWSQIELDKHIQKKHEEIPMWTCNLCQKVMRETSKYCHIEVHHSNKAKSSICKVCGQGFRNDSIRRQHERKHETKRKYSCDACQGRFTSNDRTSFLHHEYARHGILAPGATLFDCDICQYRSPCESMTRRHRKNLHAERETPVCEVCGKQCANQEQLKKHVLHIHGEGEVFSCPECSANYETSGGLSYHRWKIHRVGRNGRGEDDPDHWIEKPYKCYYCSHASGISNNTKKHIVNVHKGLPLKVIDLREVRAEQKWRLKKEKEKREKMAKMIYKRSGEGREADGGGDEVEPIVGDLEVDAAASVDANEALAAVPSYATVNIAANTALNVASHDELTELNRQRYFPPDVSLLMAAYENRQFYAR